MSVRDFTTAANLFLDTVATFTSYELMDYATFVGYAVVCGVIALERKTIKAKVRTGIGARIICMSMFTQD